MFGVTCFFIIGIVLCVWVSISKDKKKEISARIDQSLHQFSPIETRQKEFRHKILTIARKYVALIEPNMKELLDVTPRQGGGQKLPSKADFNSAIFCIESDIENDLLSPPSENCSDIEFQTYAAHALWRVTNRLAKGERNKEVQFAYFLINAMLNRDYHFEEVLGSRNGPSLYERTVEK